MSITKRPAHPLRRHLALGAVAAFAAVGVIAVGTTSATAAPPAGCTPADDISYNITGPATLLPADKPVDPGITMALTTTNAACNSFNVLNRITLTTDADVSLGSFSVTLTSGGTVETLTFSGSGGVYTADYGPPSGFPLGLAGTVTSEVSLPPGSYTLSVALIDALSPSAPTGVTATISNLKAVGLPITTVAGPVNLTAGGSPVAAGLTTVSAGVTGAADPAKPQGTPFTYSFAPALPAGVTFDAATGTFTADATAVPGTYSVAVTTTDTLKQVSLSAVQLTITVAAAPAAPTAAPSSGAGTPLANSGAMSWPLFALGAFAVAIGTVALRARRRRTQP